MSKLCWNMVSRRDDLWVRVLRSKYRCGMDLLPVIDHGRQGSNTWSGIKSAWKEEEKYPNLGKKKNFFIFLFEIFWQEI